MHKPRKKKVAFDGLVEVHYERPAPATDTKPTFPLQSFLWTVRRGTSTLVLVCAVLTVAGLYRWTVGLWNYSGFRAPPMHGDFEAQRHWMEVTTNLPLAQWYFHDLQWWGLDYPPLTAYHSWILGTIGSCFNSGWFKLHTSRGLDDASLKTYMRATVLISEYLTYVPALLLASFCIKRTGEPARNVWIALTAILLQPGLVLIDHGHFQYNTVMLGAVVASVAFLLSDRFILGCVSFVLALAFKQMALYYAPTMFFFILGRCFMPAFRPGRLVNAVIVTATSFALLVFPFLVASFLETDVEITKAQPPLMGLFNISPQSPLRPPLVQLAQILHRVFPFARGIFEDKVANFWCSLHIVHKLTRYSKESLQVLSLGLTLLSVLPTGLALLIRPKNGALLPGLAIAGWGFFLFSFQVHEKSILLPLLPMTLMLLERNSLQPEARSWIIWANMLGCWTMFPLLKRDDLKIPYYTLSLLWAWLMGLGDTLTAPSRDSYDSLRKTLHAIFYFIMVVWHVLEAQIPPPTNKPDLWVVVNVGVGAVGCGICYLWCQWRFWARWS